VRYKLKTYDFLREAGETVAYDQLVINAHQPLSQRVCNRSWSNVASSIPMLDNTDHVYLSVIGEHFIIEFNKQDGYLCRYEVDGRSLLAANSVLAPNF